MSDKDMLALEKTLLTEPGSSSLIALDEVGRGAIAGPLAVGAVWLDKETLDKIAFARDSKSMSAKRREEMFEKLEWAVPYSIGWVDAATVDEIGITASLHRAAHLALDELPEPTSYLVDGNLDFVSTPGSPPDPRVVLQIKGDANCASIAAASVLAKVSRDRLMVEMDRQYPDYGFAGHKGYGAKTHYLAIQELGFSPIHRKTWKLPSWVTIPDS